MICQKNIFSNLSYILEIYIVEKGSLNSRYFAKKSILNQ